MKTERIKTWELALLLALNITLCTGLWAQRTQRELSDGLVRLHVIADGDEAAQQEMKLRVRDRVLEILTPRLEEAEDAQLAAEIITDSLPELETAASELTGGLPVRVTLGTESYPTREYDTFSLPAGHYTSLRVEIGSARGQNWWCVVFPPLCMDSALTEAVRTGALTDSEIALITGESEGYAVRFRLLELWGELMEKLR